MEVELELNQSCGQLCGRCCAGAANRRSLGLWRLTYELKAARNPFSQGEFCSVSLNCKVGKALGLVARVFGFQQVRK